MGGLRVKKITDFTANSVIPALIKEYEYNLPDGNSSGTLGFYPLYSNVVYYDRWWQEFEPYYWSQVYLNLAPNVLNRSSSTIHPLAYVNGSPVAYKKVIEKRIGNGIYEGKTERYFTSFDDVPYMIFRPFPYTPPEYKPWCNGLLKEILIYDKNNTILRKEENNYNYIIDNYLQNPIRMENFRSVSIAPVKYHTFNHEDEVIPYWSEPCYFKSENFYPTAGRADLVRTTTYEYDRNGGEIKSILDYEYDAENLYLKENISSTSVSGEQLRKSFIYPKDMIINGRDPNGIYQGMVNQNIINPVIEEKQKRGNNQLSLVLKNYFNPHPNVYVPNTIEYNYRSFPSEVRLRYLDYDISGKPLDMFKENNVHEVYFWGYNSQYPVAKIIGSNYRWQSSI